MQKIFRNGFTLVEILVSLGIIVVVTALGLPTVKDALQSNSLSRSADVVRGAFETARRMAVQKGLPCGVMIERRASTQRITKDSTFGASFLPDSGAANYSARLSFVQIPSNYPSNSSAADGVTAYPFYTLLGSKNDNCNKELKFYVKREDAELLYAAASELQSKKNQGKGKGRGPGNPNPKANPNAKKTPPGLASRFIKKGTKVDISVGGERLTQFIKTLELAPNGLTANDVNEYDTNSGVPPSCYPVVTDPTIEQSQSAAGVFFTTNESQIPDVSRRELGDIDLFGGKVYEPVQVGIQLSPIPMAMAPINLPGRSVIDLSVSGSRDNPLLFNVQESLATVPNDALEFLASPDGDGNRLPVNFNAVVVMFSENGAVDSIYIDRWNDSLYDFEWIRVTPPPSLAFLVGTSNSVAENVDNLANYPTALGVEGKLYEPPFVPNVMNSDCQWVHLHSQTGVSSISPIASQPSDNFFSSYFGWASGRNDNRQVAKQRVDRARRLSYGGAR